jgi:hypothetical protein
MRLLEMWHMEVQIECPFLGINFFFFILTLCVCQVSAILCSYSFLFIITLIPRFRIEDPVAFIYFYLYFVYQSNNQSIISGSTALCRLLASSSVS